MTNSRLFKDFIELLEKKHGRIAEFKFRNKEAGWKKQKWSAVFYTGKECIETEEINAFHNLYSTIIASLGYISAIGHLLQHSRRSARWIDVLCGDEGKKAPVKEYSFVIY